MRWLCTTSTRCGRYLSDETRRELEACSGDLQGVYLIMTMCGSERSRPCFSSLATLRRHHNLAVTQLSTSAFGVLEDLCLWLSSGLETCLWRSFFRQWLNVTQAARGSQRVGRQNRYVLAKWRCHWNGATAGQRLTRSNLGSLAGICPRRNILTRMRQMNRRSHVIIRAWSTYTLYSKRYSPWSGVLL